MNVRRLDSDRPLSSARSVAEGSRAARRRNPGCERANAGPILRLILTPRGSGLGSLSRLTSRALRGGAHTAIRGRWRGGGPPEDWLLSTAMSDVATDASGLALGMVNTSFMMGGALGLAILASLGAAYTDGLGAAAADAATAVNSGYHLAFLLGAIAAAMASALAGVFVRTRAHGRAQEAASSAASI